MNRGTLDLGGYPLSYGEIASNGYQNGTFSSTNKADKPVYETSVEIPGSAEPDSVAVIAEEKEDEKKAMVRVGQLVGQRSCSIDTTPRYSS